MNARIRTLTLTFCLSALLIGTATAQDATANVPEGELTTRKDKLSYAIGMQIGMQLKQLVDEGDVDAVVLQNAIKEVLGGKEPRLTPQQAMQVQQEFFMEMQQKQQEEMEAAGKVQAEEGAKFLEENKKNTAIKVTESGLQYEVMRKGEGLSPKLGDTVKVHYEGRLLDGTIFDSSYERGEPVEFQVGRVIPGWVEGLQLMQEGAKYRLFIPSNLAYGPEGAGRDIPPNATLIFTVELLNVTKAATE